MYTTYTGERVRLRPFTDADEYIRVTRWGLEASKETWGCNPLNLAGERQRYGRDGYIAVPGMCQLAIEHFEQQKVIGSMSCASPQSGIAGGVGTYIDSEFRGQRLGVEARQLCLCLLFESLPLLKVEAITLSTNRAARTSLERCGLHYEGAKAGTWYSHGRWESMLYYALFREEWEVMEYRHKVKRGA